MSDHTFVFALDLSDAAPFDFMLAEVSRAVFGHAGYSPEAVTEWTLVLQGALSTGAAAGPRPCTVRFQAHGSELEVVVSFAGGGEWRTSRPLP